MIIIVSKSPERARNELEAERRAQEESEFIAHIQKPEGTSYIIVYYFSYFFIIKLT